MKFIENKVGKYKYCSYNIPFATKIGIEKFCDENDIPYLARGGLFHVKNKTTVTLLMLRFS